MNRLWWVLVAALLAVDIAMLAERQQQHKNFLALEQKSDTAMLKAKYAAEEENILNVIGSVPATFPRIRTAGPTEDVVQFFLLASIKDCTNAVEDEVLRLNSISRKKTSRVAGVQGFFVDEDQPAIARRFITNLSPSPDFPMAVRNVLSHLPAPLSRHPP